MTIEYKINAPLSVDQFVEVLRQSTLGERRPVEDLVCMQGMLEHGNLMVSAWDGEELIGIARSVTDFHFACYLSDLAVKQRYQGQGVGKELQSVTQAQLGPKCTLILIAAPAADSYYEHLGFTKNPRCWVLRRGESLIR